MKIVVEKLNNKYTIVTRRSTVYFIQTYHFNELLNKHGSNFLTDDTGWGGEKAYINPYHNEMKMLSDFIIDTTSQSIIKCRYELKSILVDYLRNNTLFL